MIVAAVTLSITIAGLPQPQQRALVRGESITQSTTIRRDTYFFPNEQEDGRGAALTIRGSNLVIDFNGATLRGSAQTTLPNERVGTAIYVEGRNITIKNLNVHGYKIGLVARDTDNLQIIDCDFSYNWKQRLNSTPEREDLSDWMSFHNNENDEWLRFGAGIYLSNCDNFLVEDTTIVGGQCGLMITRSDHGTVKNNNFSFLSAIGLGLYRSSFNTVMHNKIDWCVRGYSHLAYNRGQDSSGILIYEQCHNNVFAYNSVTHGGDGFFLWAGQTTMDTGTGGCNDNLLFGNDFSHAPTNGIEATFSRNRFANNLMLECWHGVWGGYSYDTEIIGNVFGLNAEGIALEHGQDNLIRFNVFHHDNDGIVLWQKESEDPNWGYPKHRDTRARDNVIEYNFFNQITRNAFRIWNTTDTAILNNVVMSSEGFLEETRENFGTRIEGNNVVVKSRAPDSDSNTVEEDGSVEVPPAVMRPSGLVIGALELPIAEYLERFNIPWYPFLNTRQAHHTPDQHAMIEQLKPNPLQGGINPFLKEGELRGRRFIIVDEWGPYDFKSPKLVYRTETRSARSGARVWNFEILGPPGRWTIKAVKGGTLTSTGGQVPGEVSLNLNSGNGHDVIIELEYVGEETVDFRGIVTPRRTPVSFKYETFFLPMEWTVEFYNYDPATQEPRTMQNAFALLLAGDPDHVINVDELNFAWPGSPAEGIGANHFATVATTTFSAPPGQYELEITSDDGVRVFLDDQKIFEDWTWHAPKTDTITIRVTGEHRLRIEHFEIDGYAALKAVLRPLRN